MGYTGNTISSQTTRDRWFSRFTFYFFYFIEDIIFFLCLVLLFINWYLIQVNWPTGRLPRVPVLKRGHYFIVYHIDPVYWANGILEKTNIINERFYFFNTLIFWSNFCPNSNRMSAIYGLIPTPHYAI